MKMRRLPETELARIAVKSKSEQELALARLKGFKPRHTLNPFRRAIPDLMNLQHDMLPETKRSPWSAIEALIMSSKETEEGKECNLAVAKALFDFASDLSVSSFSKPIPKWQVGFGNAVEYWQDFYSIWSDKASFVHFDPRLSNPLTKEARRFAFSMMHERLRVDDPDFAQVNLTIFQFGKADDGERVVKLHEVEDVDLYSRDELNEMITVTYMLWAEELKKREDEQRYATGTDNPMGF